MSGAIPTAVLNQHIAFIGKTGSGKTSTAKLAIEQVVAAGHRVCILDTIKSDHWGLTSSADGRHAGLPFQILGGPHGHVPLHPTSGTVIGKLVAEGSLPLSIVDTADFSGGQLNKFFIDFAAALWKQMRGVLYLVIEEAHELAPKERAGVGDENLALHWAKKLATGARSKGLRLFVLTQRLQSLHNALLGSCDTLIAHRLTLPADQKPALDWLKANLDKATVDEVAASLASLPTGTGWVCSGEAQIHKRVAFPRIATYDNSATPTSRSGAHKVKTAPVDLDKLRTILGDAVKEAQANDPRALKSRIAELEKQLKAQPTQAPPKIVEKPVIPAKDITRLEQLGDQLIKAYATAAAKEGEFINAAEAIKKLAAPVRTFVAPSQPVVRPTTPVRSLPVRQAAGAAADGISSAEQRVLNSLAWWRTIGIQNPERVQVAFIAGYTVNGHFNNLCGALRTAGYIDYAGNGTMSLVGDGLTVAVHPTAPPTQAALHTAVRDKLTSAQQRLFDVLLAAGETLDSRTLAERSGYTVNGHFNNVRGSLHSLDVVQYVSGGTRLSDWLFPRELA